MEKLKISRNRLVATDVEGLTDQYIQGMYNLTITAYTSSSAQGNHHHRVDGAHEPALAEVHLRNHPPSGS